MMKNTRPHRRIVSEVFPYSFTNIIFDETKMAVRVLCPIEISPKKTELEETELSIPQLLNTTASLATPFMDASLQNPKYVFEIDGKRYVVGMEAIFDKENPVHAEFWKPMAYLIFAVTDQGELVIEDPARYTKNLKLRTNHYAELKHYRIIAQVFCRDVTDKINECATSISMRKNGKCITNVPEGEIHTADHVNNVKGSSRWLNILPKLTYPATCKPNELVTIKVQFYQGGTENKVQEPINWDGLCVYAIDGYCPHTRVKIRNGYGEFKVRALDLVDGDTMRIKVGTKYYTHKAECIINVKK